MTHSYSLPWCDPLHYARSVARSYPQMVFLYSSLSNTTQPNYSYLCYDVKEEITAAQFNALTTRLSSSNPGDLTHHWFGYLSYAMRHDVETLPTDLPDFISMPPMWMSTYHQILIFDHAKQLCTFYTDRADTLPPTPIETGSSAFSARVQDLTSNMTKEDYLQKVEHILSAIERGDLYQANLTRKFYGSLHDPCDSFETFVSLCTLSPSSYSAYLKYHQKAILSSSPELFLKANAEGNVHVEPIKGTAPRYTDPVKDQASRTTLRNSIKDQSENLMIVDLMRNDLSRTCVPGSVITEALFDIKSHATVHHMSSLISGKKLPNMSIVELIKHCFPPGSMTGAPKMKAMQLCSQLEKQERGIYSGAIGHIGSDQSAHLSVVIRTLLLEEQRFEFQVGGAIVAGSEPIKEWEETLIKAAAIARVLNLDPQKDLIF